MMAVSVPAFESPDAISGPSNEPSFDELVLGRAAARGDSPAFAELMRRSQRAVFGLCFRLLGEKNTAADATQESYVRAFSAISSFCPEQRFDLWVLRIARNLCFDSLRRKNQRTDNLSNQEVDTSPGPLEQLEAAEVTLNLETALESLPIYDRELITLYYVQRLKTREIAEILNVAPGTVMARLFRARQKLRKHLQEVTA